METIGRIGNVIRKGNVVCHNTIKHNLQLKSSLHWSMLCSIVSSSFRCNICLPENLWFPVGCCRGVPRSCKGFEWFATTLFSTWRCWRTRKALCICKREWQEQCGLRFSVLTWQGGRVCWVVDRKVWQLQSASIPSEIKNILVNVCLMCPYK